MRMKRFTWLSMTTLALCVLTLAAGALAEGLSVEMPGDVIPLTIDHCVPGNEYVLLMLKEGASLDSLQDSDILFIDQYTASGSTVLAGIVYPDFSRFDAAVGGVFSDGAASPRRLGTFWPTKLPEQLSVIEPEAFVNTRFTHLFLGGAVTAIGSRAFADCGKLEYVYIPASVTEIAGDAFSGSGRVTIGCAQGSAAQAFAQANGLPVRLTD